MIAAAILRPSCQSQQNPEGAQIPRGVVAGSGRQQLGTIGTAFMADAGHGLGDLFPARAMAERAIGPEAADRDIDDAGAMRRQLFWPEAQSFKRAWAIAL